MNAFIQDNSILFDNLDVALIMQGYFGKCPKYLVNMATEESHYYYNGQYEEDFSSYTWDYKLDSDGYVEIKKYILDDGRSFPSQFYWENK